MSKHTIPLRPDLSKLKKHAKILLQQCREKNQEALFRIIESHPKYRTHSTKTILPESIQLSDTQFVIAREFGAPSWPKLKRLCELLHMDQPKRAAWLLESLCKDNMPLASMLLAADESLSRFDLACACATGDLDKVRALIQDNPINAKSRCGGLQWEPLLYVCFSRFLSTDPARAKKLLDIAKLLLKNGANPNVTWDDPPQSALAGAAGENNHTAMTKLLLQSGANPNDSNALYCSSSFDGIAALKEIVLFGINKKEGATALLHKLDFNRMDDVRWLLEHGLDPNQRGIWGKTALHQAVLRKRTLDFMILLLDYGQDVNAKNDDGLSAYQLAARMGWREAMNLLKARGADTNLGDKDQFLSACSFADEEEAKHLLSQNPSMMKTLSLYGKQLINDACDLGHADAVALMLDVGFDIEQKGAWGGSPLHHAGWFGHPDVVKVLLQRGASIKSKSQYNNTPLDSTVYGASNCPNQGGQYIETIELLLQAGASPNEVSPFPTGNSEIDDRLEKWRLINDSH